MSTKTPHVPTFPDAMENFRKDLGYRLYCHLPGTVVSFNRTKMTANVAVALKQVIPDYTVPTGQRVFPYPTLSEVPVFALQGGGASVGADPAAGDPCLICVLDRNIDAWFQGDGQQPQAPLSDRAHDLSDAFCLVGFNPLAKPLVSARLAGECGVADAAAKVVVKNGLVNISNGPLPANSLGGILDIFFTATAGATSVAQIAAAAAAAKASLATLMPSPFL